MDTTTQTVRKPRKDSQRHPSHPSSVGKSASKCKGCGLDLGTSIADRCWTCQTAYEAAYAARRRDERNQSTLSEILADLSPRQRRRMGVLS
jgi:hypothetical protein